MSVPVFMLPEAGVGTLIGRAWTLVRLNLKATVLLMIAPILLYTLVSILFSVPSGINTLIHTASTQILVLLLSLGAGFALSIGAWFVVMGSFCMLSHLYYSTLTRGEPAPMSESVRFVLGRWPGLLLLFAGNFVLYMVFLVGDVLFGAFG